MTDATPTRSSSRQKVVDARDRWDGAGDALAARASVFTSVDPVPVGKANPWHNGGTGTNAEVPADRILIEPPPSPTTRARIAGFSPVKVGYLIDIDTGALLGDCLDAAILGVRGRPERSRDLPADRAHPEDRPRAAPR